MVRTDVLNFGGLLAPQLSQVPGEALPYALGRTATTHYREWAQEVSAYQTGLFECARREDEIAEHVEAMFPPTDEPRQLVASLIPGAKETYYQAFSDYTSMEQVEVQEDAENRGANAWQGLREAYPEKASQLDELSEIKLGSAQYLKTNLP